MTDAEQPVDEWNHALQYVNNDMHAELEYVRAWADSVEFDYDEGPTGIGFTKAGATYWYLIDDIGWDSDDPRGEVIAELIAALESARRERDEARVQLDCASAGCGTDEQYACRRCCRIMLANYAANHGTRCDAEQERLTAALHTARAEAEQLRAERDDWDSALQATCKAHLAAKAEAEQLRAERDAAALVANAASAWSRAGRNPCGECEYPYLYTKWALFNRRIRWRTTHTAAEKWAY